MQGRQRKYWAFLANPKVYRIEEAIQQEEDSWTVPRGDVRAGDRVIICKAKGNDQQRGIVALAEVLTDPIPAKAHNEQYWVDQQKASEQVDRVQVRYYQISSVLPLWDNRSDVPLLKELSVARSTGGSIFHVTPDQWDTLMELVGGWPGSTPEIASVERAITEYTGKIRSGQGYVLDADLRRAIEQCAMEHAKAFYEKQGWSVVDVSATHSYDLLCTSVTGKELHVEVKGTTSDGTQFLLTANEVTHAQNFYPNVALFILSHIRVASTAPTKLEGGEIQCLEPWNIGEGTLSPLAFSYRRGK